MSTDPRPQKITPDQTCAACIHRYWVAADPLGSSMSGWGCRATGGHAIEVCELFSPAAPTVTPEGGEPAPAESETPDPQRLADEAVPHLELYTDGNAASVNSRVILGAIYGAVNPLNARIARLEAERNQARRERDELKIGLHNEYERAERFLGERNDLRHTLATAEAALEANETTLSNLLNDAKAGRAFGPYAVEGLTRALETTRATLATAAEQALKEKQT